MFKILQRKKIHTYPPFTISLSYYNDGDFLMNQIAAFREYLNEIKIQIIDDGSQSDPIDQYINKIPKNISIYKITSDIAWNIPGVRNLGSMIASTPWILHLDMDHIVPKQSIKKILEIDFSKQKKFYSFNRKVNGKTKFTAGTLLISRDDFWSCGGYDEDFAGTYGHNDPYLRYKLNYFGVKEIKLKDVWLEDYGEEASCKLSRNEIERNQILMQKKIRQKEFFSKSIRFDWKKISR